MIIPGSFSIDWKILGKRELFWKPGHWLAPGAMLENGHAGVRYLVISAEE
jgi:hypothetical protein